MKLEKAIEVAKTLVEDGGRISDQELSFTQKRVKPQDGGRISDQELEAIECLINIAEQVQKENGWAEK